MQIFIYEGGPKKTKTKPKNLEFTYKKLCIYFYVFKLRVPSKYSPSDAIHLWKWFFHCSKQLLNLSILMPVGASAIFLFHFFHVGKMFPFEDLFFIWGTKIKLLRTRSSE